MNRNEQAELFHSLHVKGNPCLLYNVWDAGTAHAVEQAGARVIATGSWSVAAAHGYEDGEAIPFDLVERIVARICSTVALPVTVDVEGGYAEAPTKVVKNVTRIVEAGAIGINFEDRVVKGEGLYELATQANRIHAIREMAEQWNLRLFINARTDLFLQAESATHVTLMTDAKERAREYAEAGASGFFTPGLLDTDLIGQLCEHVELPVNIMMMDGAPTANELSRLDVSRISYGPGPFFSAMRSLTKSATAVYKSVNTQ